MVALVCLLTKLLAMLDSCAIIAVRQIMHPMNAGHCGALGVGTTLHSLDVKATTASQTAHCGIASVQTTT